MASTNIKSHHTFLCENAADLFEFVRRRPSKRFHQKRLSFTRNSQHHHQITQLTM
ncbi:unnamed protein product [Fusarium graminearum]|uniref:Chromosome 1, complete genome n=1 Tax=Gibberella zeae (strain ATCC MYA-4620 / CBS 123657 / FGSC 9075 / NRRL 31084 / PH-1) TaxID=229533 RepID=A0A098D2X3_GIBZE|nr:unnamed protein product [Fusarium graminearum]